MILRKILSLTCELKHFSQCLWMSFCIIVMVATVVMATRYSLEASDLRSWWNERNDANQIATNVNMSTLKKFIQFWESNIASDNKSSEKSYAVSEVNKDLNVSTSLEDMFRQSGQNDDDDTICTPLPPKDDFTKCGNRLADRKCCEFIWALKYKDDLMKYSECISDMGIIGGVKVKQGEFLHMAAVGFKYRNRMGQYSYKCGGSLISDRFVLTAAHCTLLPSTDPEFEPRPAVVGMGGIILKKMRTFRIADTYTHDKYNSPRYDYDIGLLKLLVAVVFSYQIHPACLSTELILPYTIGNVTGWGTTNLTDKTHMSDHLYVATVNILNRETCRPIFRRKIVHRNINDLKRHHVCAGVFNGTADTCKGDSGGPLQVRINTTYGNIHRVIGVTSFGRRCASSVPGVYVSVATVLTWIEKIVWPKERRGEYHEGLPIGKD